MERTSVVRVLDKQATTESLLPFVSYLRRGEGIQSNDYLAANLRDSPADWNGI
jgi:hypothetical protein